MDEKLMADLAQVTGSTTPTEGNENTATEPESTEAGEEVAQEEEVEADESEPTEADDQQEPEKKQTPKGVEKRIGELTRKKHELERQAEAQAAELAHYRALAQQAADANKQAEPIEPTLEDFDYDRTEYNQAILNYQKELVDYRVTQALAKQTEAQAEQARAAMEKTSMEKTQAEYTQRSIEYAKKNGMTFEDFREVQSKVPLLPMGLINAIKAHERGPEIAHRLALNEAEALKLASMDPVSAALKVGQIVAELNKVEKPKIKTTSAPEPIKPIQGKSKVSKSLREMSLEEMERKFYPGRRSS